jgi:anti-sigma regulatory factor (Ser/Thr protein kinase)
MCGYDAREHPDAVLEGARHTHPRVVEETAHDNPHYHDPAQVVRAVTPEPEALPDLRRLPLPADATTFRRVLLHEMTADGVPATVAHSLLIAAGEILTNARVHGNGLSALRVGLVNGHFVCEICDHGPGPGDSLTGYLPPRPGRNDGAGVWVARQLTSRLEFLPTPEGCAARLWT